MFIAGAVVQWLRDEMKFIANAAESEALAHSVPDSGGVVVVPAFTGLGAPHWKPDARGAMFGITRGTTPRAHRPRCAGVHRLSDDGRDRSYDRRQRRDA